LLVRNIKSKVLYVAKPILLSETKEIINEEVIGMKLAKDCLYLVSYVESFEDKDSKYFIMEYFKKGDLQTLIDKKIKEEKSSFEEKVCYSLYH
jgi:serine/threonine protein kinase